MTDLLTSILLGQLAREKVSVPPPPPPHPWGTLPYEKLGGGAKGGGGLIVSLRGINQE